MTKAEIEQAEAELKVCISAPEYTSGSPPPAPPSLAYTRVATVGEREHRATGKPKGRPPKQDGALADSVRHVAAGLRIGEAAAVRKVADFVVETSKITKKAARARARKALRNGD
jgi:hypothetical protein